MLNELVDGGLICGQHEGFESLEGVEAEFDKGDDAAEVGAGLSGEGSVTAT